METTAKAESGSASPTSGKSGTSRKSLSPQDRITLGIVTGIVVLGLALRLWGLGWSLPDTRHPLATYHPDETINLSAAVSADIPHGKFDIGFYNYGAFYFYMVSLAQTVGRGYGAIPSTPAPQEGATQVEQWQKSVPERAALFFTGRLVTALLGTGTILALFALGNRLFGRKAGYLAALLYALAPLAVVHAHFLTVDVPATFFVTLALLWSARLLEFQTWQDYGLAAIWCGLAAATKYNAGLVLVAPIAAHFLNVIPGTCRQHRGAQFVVLLAVSALTFLLACPGPWINLEAFWDGTYPGSGVRYELFEHARTGHGDLFIDTGPGWWYHLVISLRYGLGIPLLLLCLAGLLYACKKRSKGDLLLLAFFAIYYLATGLSAVRFARYMIPLFPILCLWAARLVLEPFPRRAAMQAWMAVGAVTVLATGLYTVSLVRLMTLTDPRDACADSLEKSAPQGASIAFAKVPWFFSPPLSPYFGAPAAPIRAKAAEVTTRFQFRISGGEWDTQVLTPPPDYVVLSNFETMHAVDRLHQPGPTKFVQAIPSSYTRQTFGPAAPVVNMAGGGPILPEDLLYIMPTLTLYSKR